MAELLHTEQTALDALGQAMIASRPQREQRVSAILGSIESAHPLTQGMAYNAIKHYLAKRDHLNPLYSRQPGWKETKGNVPGMVLAFGDLYSSLYQTGEFIGWNDFIGITRTLKKVQPVRTAMRAIDRLYIQTTVRNPTYEPDSDYKSSLLSPSMTMCHSIENGDFPSKSALFHHELVEEYVDYLRGCKTTVPNISDAVICLTFTDDLELLNRVVPTRFKADLLSQY